jgi:putative acetyltransferase
MAHSPATEVRPVREADVSEVIAVVTRVLGEFGLRFGDGADTDAELHSLPNSYRDHGGELWVATDAAGHVVGTCGVFPVADGTFELRKMYLLPRVRGQGLGQRLLDVALHWTRQRGATRVVLDTTEAMARAIEFYEKNGFVRDDAEVRGARCSRGYVRRLA